MSGAALLVIAKDPQPGRCKTRLCPPCTSDQAARLAAAALSDTLDVVTSITSARSVLVLDGDPSRWRRPGLEIVPQRGRGLAERLAGAFADTGGPALLVGMDTPQLTAELLSDGLRALHEHDAVLGPAADGGYWSVGLRSPCPDAFAGVPMSTDQTHAQQLRRFDALGLDTYCQPELRDVDTIADAYAVAALAAGSRFAATLRSLR